MNWNHLRGIEWLDRRAQFVSHVPLGGTLLDLGSSDGETLGHIAELRPDLAFFAADMAGKPENYPPRCQFHRCNLEQDCLPWADATIDAITCMHLVEHLQDPNHLLMEAVRLLKPGGRIYIETPHPKTVTYSSPSGKMAGVVGFNFYDDPTHIRPVSIGSLADRCRQNGLGIACTGISRNWLFAAAYVFYFWAPASRKKYTCKGHFYGWSSYLVAQKPV